MTAGADFRDFPFMKSASGIMVRPDHSTEGSFRILS